MVTFVVMLAVAVVAAEAWLATAARSFAAVVERGPWRWPGPPWCP